MKVYVTPSGQTVKVLENKFKKSNANTYGTKLLGALFTKEEIKKGYIEPTPEQEESGRFTSLDQNRIDLIKGIFK